MAAKFTKLCRWQHKNGTLGVYNVGDAVPAELEAEVVAAGYAEKVAEEAPAAKPEEPAPAEKPAAKKEKTK